MRQNSRNGKRKCHIIKIKNKMSRNELKTKFDKRVKWTKKNITWNNLKKKLRGIKHNSPTLQGNKNLFTQIKFVLRPRPTHGNMTRTPQTEKKKHTIKNTSISIHNYNIIFNNFLVPSYKILFEFLTILIMALPNVSLFILHIFLHFTINTLIKYKKFFLLKNKIVKVKPHSLSINL
jgi:hypothetical protein